MCGSLFLSAGKLFYPQQRVKPFRRSGGLPPQARLALPGRGLFAMTWREKLPPSAAGGGRAHGRGQEGKDNQGFLSPLNSPNFPSSRSAEHSRLNGGYGGSVPCVGQLLGRITAPNLLCVNRSAVSARPDSAGRQRSAAKSSASIKDEALEHQTPLWAPRF